MSEQFVMLSHEVMTSPWWKRQPMERRAMVVELLRMRSTTKHEAVFMGGRFTVTLDVDELATSDRYLAKQWKVGVASVFRLFRAMERQGWLTLVQKAVSKEELSVYRLTGPLATRNGSRNGSEGLPGTDASAQPPIMTIVNGRDHGDPERLTDPTRNGSRNKSEDWITEDGTEANPRAAGAAGGGQLVLPDGPTTTSVGPHAANQGGGSRMAEAFAEIYRRVEQSESSPSMRCWILGEVYRALDPLTLTEDQSLELLETIRRARVPADGLPKVCADWVTTLTGTPGELFSLPAKPPVAEKPNGNASVQLFEAKWKARHGGMELGMTKGEAIQIQGVAKRWPEAITQMIERFFASDDQWYVRSGHSVSAFMTRITSLRVGEPPAPPRQRHGLHVIAPGDFAKSGKLNLRTGKLEAI